MHSEAFYAPREKLFARVVQQFPARPPRWLGAISVGAAFALVIIILVGIAG